METALIPSWSTVSFAKQLWTLEWARTIAGGHIDEAIDRLAEDAAFWRRLLAEPQLSLIDKMVMIAYLRCDFQLASSLIRSHPLETAQLEALRPIAAPLTATERSLEGALQEEFRIATEIVFGYGHPPPANQPPAPSLIHRAQGWIERRFLVRNATINLLYQRNRIDIEIDRDPCTQFAANEKRQLGFLPPGWLTFWYNPTGKELVGMSSAPFREYSGRMCDIEGFQRLLALQLLLHQNNVGDDRIAGFIQQAGPDYADPYTGAPMQWEAQQHALSFSASFQRNREILPWPI